MRLPRGCSGPWCQGAFAHGRANPGDLRPPCPACSLRRQTFQVAFQVKSQAVPRVWDVPSWRHRELGPHSCLPWPLLSHPEGCGCLGHLRLWTKTPVSCGQPPSDDLSVGAGQVTGELELFLRRPLAEKLLIHCPSTLLSPSSAPRLCRATEIGVRKGGRPEGQGAANWPAERSGARGCFFWS